MGCGGLGGHARSLCITRKSLLLVVPGHVCPTTICYPGIHMLDTGGEVVDYYLHTARDRL